MKTLTRRMNAINPVNILAPLAILASLCLIQLNGATAALGYQHIVVALIITAALTAFKFWLQRKPAQRPFSIPFYALSITFVMLATYFTGELDSTRIPHALAWCLLVSALTIPVRPQPTSGNLTTKSSDK
ncbi:MAG: hypothetical protein HRT35_10325 [Algicola sp.]|nr:hypothetical protein [Algicola sp.]